jgi:hypothetical protein
MTTLETFDNPVRNSESCMGILAVALFASPTPEGTGPATAVSSSLSS